jgi:hypothetical protein
MNKNVVDFYKVTSPAIKDFCKPLDDYLGIPFFPIIKFTIMTLPMHYYPII